jgi:hypothetical protein
MNHLWDFRILGAAQLPVTISGEWTETPHRMWRGTAAAPEQLVALVVVAVDEVVHWVKSNSAIAMDMQLILHPAPVPQNHTVDWHRVYSHWHIAHVGHSLPMITVQDPAYRPVISEKQSTVTGEMTRFAAIQGQPQIGFGVLFLARSDVKFGRKRIWRLKQPLISNIEEPWARILTIHRVGTVSGDRRV